MAAVRDYSRRALDVLKQNGYRLTEPRKRVIEILSRVQAPVAAYDIKGMLDEEGVTADVTSVYRILECLEKNHLIHKTFQQGKVFRCELADAHGCHSHSHQDHVEHDGLCHHFIVCKRCESIQEVHCHGLEDVIEQLKSNFGFSADSHVLQVSGLCQNCNT